MKRLALALALTALPSAAFAGSTVLSAGELRIDFAPNDFSILNTGAIGGMRGFHVRHFDAGPVSATAVFMGLGASYGFDGRIEAGILLLPIGLSNSDGFGDITTHARYRILTGDFEAAVQAAIQIPTSTNFGVGLGVPVIFRASGFELQSGAELELIFADNTVANLDVPATFLFNVTPRVFAGVRTGLFIPNFDDFDIPLGGVAGARLVLSNDLTLNAIASFVFDQFITTRPNGAVELGLWTLSAGVSVHFKT